MFRKFTTMLGIATAMAVGAVTLVTTAPFAPTEDGVPQMIVCADTDTDANTMDDPLSIAQTDLPSVGGLPNSLCNQIKRRTETIASL